MARKSRTAVLKRQREAKKAEKMAAKKEKKEFRRSQATGETEVANADDLEAYGFTPSTEDADDADRP